MYLTDASARLARDGLIGLTRTLAKYAVSAFPHCFSAHGHIFCLHIHVFTQQTQIDLSWADAKREHDLNSTALEQ